MLLSASEHAAARQSKSMASAVVVETAQYIPCGDRCSPTAPPARAFCLRSGGQTLVGDGRSFLHQTRFSSMDDFGGMRVRMRFNRRWIWLQTADGSEIKIHRGSKYEGFRDRACLAEVNRPILAWAKRQKRPARIPATALAIAGPQSGSDPQRFLWYACAMGPDAATISCRRWYHNGDPYVGEWYCARTLDGKSVGTNFAIDPLESQAGRLVLNSGGVLELDNRLRIDGRLERPGEPCF
jgi:hypothetical protein